MLFEVKDVDRRVYEEKIRGSLPERIIDCHTHVFAKQGGPPPQGPETDERLVSWPERVADQNPIADLMETYRLMLPGKTVTPLIFANVRPSDRLYELNGFSLEEARKAGVPSLLYVHPEWDPETLEEKLEAEGRQGIKVYLNLAPAYIPAGEIRIFDFLPPAHLEVVDRLGLIVMLHIPRPGRLRDPVNLAQILEIETRYRNLHLIVAHVGRAYCREDAGKGLDVLGRSERLVFDVSANTNAWVFARALEAVGPKRLLFGSDLPITRMRMRRVCENGVYVNLVPRGLYGDVSADEHMREVDETEAAKLTFFLYEEILAVLAAAREVGLGQADLDEIFYGNSRRILEAAGYSFDTDSV